MMLLSNMLLLGNKMFMMLFTCSKPTTKTPGTRRENCPKPTIKTPEQRQTADFEQANACWELLKSCPVE